MKILSINNSPMTKKTNVDISAQHKNPQTTSFKGVIIDERGVQELSKPLSGKLMNVLKEIKESLKNELGELAESPEHDILLHPFRAKKGDEGIEAIIPYEGSTSYINFLSNDYQFTAEYLLNFMKKCLPKSTTFAKQTSENKSFLNRLKGIKNRFSESTIFSKIANKNKSNDSLWNIEKPLPKDVIENRFNAEGLIITHKQMA